MRYAVPHRNQVATASGLDVLAGLWLLISPFLLQYHRYGASETSYATTNDVIFGIIIGIIALVRFSNTESPSWLSWINAILGLWILISPWALGYSNYRTPLWNNVIFGIIVIALSCWSGISTETEGSSTTTRTDSGDFTRR